MKIKFLILSLFLANMAYSQISGGSENGKDDIRQEAMQYLMNKPDANQRMMNFVSALQKYAQAIEGQKYKKIAEQRSDSKEIVAALDGLVEATGKILPEKSTSKAKFLSGLAVLYAAAFEYNKAENLCLKGLAIAENNQKGNVDYALKIKQMLCLIYNEIGDSKRAINIAKECLDICKNNKSISEKWKVKFLEALTLSYSNEGNYLEAELASKEALDIINNTQSGSKMNRDLDIALALQSRSFYLKSVGKYEECIEINKRILSLITDIPSVDKLIDKNEFQNAMRKGQYEFEAKKTLYECYVFLGRIDDAKTLENELEKEMGEVGPTTEKGQYYALKAIRDQIAGEKGGAIELFNKYLAYQNDHILYAMSLTESSRLGWQRKNLNFSLPVAFSRANQLADLVIKWKGIVLDSIVRDRKISAKNHNAKFSKDFQRIYEINQKIVQLSINSSDKNTNYKDTLNSLQKEKFDIEKRLLPKSVNTFNNSNLNRSLVMVRKAMIEGDIIIDFISYRKLPNIFFGEQFIGAIVIPKNGDCIWIPIGSSKLISDTITTYNKSLFLNESSDKLIREAGIKLSDIIWGEIQKAIPPTTKNIFICPDAGINFVSFPSLILSDGSFLSEKYSISYLGSSQDLCFPVSGSQNQECVIYANPQFKAVEQINNEKNNSHIFDDYSNITLPELPGTILEASVISNAASLSQITTVVNVGNNADKKSIMSITSPRILHLATHGFYLNDKTDVVTDSQRGMTVKGIDSNSKSTVCNATLDPMVLSGIALSGAQTTLNLWKQGIAPNPSNDGILSAEDVSYLDLNGTWLVTLSACDTGKGEVRSGEGVFGLRRAFMMAGAQNLLMTLWPVSDEVTPKIMADFYKEALATHDAAGSLAKVQREWLVKLRKEKGLLAAVRDAGPFAMVVMANPNVKPLPESATAEVSVSETVTASSSASPDSSESIKVLEFSDALSKADAGDAYSQAVVSIHYALGYKTEKDLAKAAEYAAKSAGQNHPLGQYQLGVLTAGGDGVEKDPERGKELKVEAIEGLNTLSDDPYALAALGAMALRGEGVAKDMKKAAKLYKRSADLGYAPAQVLYSMMLTKGVGISSDASAARKYASMAEEQNYHP